MLSFFYLQLLKTKKHILNHKLHNHKQTIYIASHFGKGRGLSDSCCPTLKASQMQVGQTVIKEHLMQSCSLQSSTQIILSVTRVQVLPVWKAKTLSSILFLQCGFAENKKV